MNATNERPVFTTPGSAGFNAPKMPETNSASHNQPRNYDPASGRSSASYPVRAFEQRLDASSRDFT